MRLDESMKLLLSGDVMHRGDSVMRNQNGDVKRKEEIDLRTHVPEHVQVRTYTNRHVKNYTHSGIIEKNRLNSQSPSTRQ